MNYLTLLVLADLAALLWFGIRGGTRERELNAFLTAGGSAGALLCAFSLVSTIIGGSATLGMGALAQKVGPAAFWWLGVGAVGLFLHGLIIAPVIRKLPVVTLPDVLSGPGGRKMGGRHYRALLGSGDGRAVHCTARTPSFHFGRHDS